MSYVLAVDGGNTKTVALIASLDGTILGSGRGGSADIYNSFDAGTGGLSHADFALANIEYAVMQALQAAHVAADEIAASVFNIAGADWPEDITLLHIVMRARNFGKLILVQNDALGILHSGSSTNTGVSVVCGTGAATGARGPDGRVWHTSFWQRVGGGVELGKKAFDAIMLSDLGLAEPTTLTHHLLEMFNKETVEDVLHLLTAREAPAEISMRLNGLTPLLLDEAERGDKTAHRIVWEHGWELGGYAITAARRVGIEHTPFHLVLAGGVLRHHSTLLADAIIARVRETSPDIQVVSSPYEPIIGVLFSALEIAGVTIDEAVHAKINASHPGEAFFETRFGRSFVPALSTSCYTGGSGGACI